MCTLEQRGKIYILTLTGSGEHRLNPTLLDSIRSSLIKLRSKPASPSSVLITTADGKYFSNGFDLSYAKLSPQHPQILTSKLRSVISELLCLPMPTIAAVTGHASAAGMMLAMSHDYVLMRRDRGFLYMSEMDIELVIPHCFMELLKSKIGDAKVRHEVIMTAPKLTAEMAVARGFVHSAHDGAEATIDAAVRLAEELARRKWNGDVYAQNRMVLFSEVLRKLEVSEDGEQEAKTRSRM